MLQSSPFQGKSADASDKTNFEGALKENPNIVSQQYPAVNDSEGNLKKGISPQINKAPENSSDMNFNSIEATAVNEAKKVEESSSNEVGDAAAANAEANNESADKPRFEEECRNSTMEAIASSSRHNSTKQEKGGVEGGQLKENTLKENTILNRGETSEFGEDSRGDHFSQEKSVDRDLEKSKKRLDEFQNESRETAFENKSEKFVDSKLDQKRKREDESGSAKKKEKVEPGLIYLLAHLTAEMMKRGGVQTKEEAEQLVGL